MATKTTKPATEETVVEAVAETPAVPEKKMVSIRLFKDNDKYSNDVFASVNGEKYQIKRGVQVEVPDYIAKVLEDSMAQDLKAAAMVEELEKGTKL